MVGMPKVTTVVNPWALSSLSKNQLVGMPKVMTAVNPWERSSLPKNQRIIIEIALTLILESAGPYPWERSSGGLLQRSRCASSASILELLKGKHTWTCKHWFFSNPLSRKMKHVSRRMHGEVESLVCASTVV